MKSWLSQGSSVSRGTRPPCKQALNLDVVNSTLHFGVTQVVWLEEQISTSECEKKGWGWGGGIFVCRGEVGGDGKN